MTPKLPTALTLIALLAATLPAAGAGLDFEHLAALRAVGEVRISPDGSRVAFTRVVPRRPGVDEDGPAWRELHVVPAAGGPARAFVTGDVSVSAIRFTPDGRAITYLAKRLDDEHATLWSIPVDGGESVRLVQFDGAIEAYELSPDGARITFVAAEPEPETRKKAKEKGFKQEVFEEDWLPRRAWIAPMPPVPAAVADPAAPAEKPAPPRQIPVDGAVFHCAFSPDGASLLLDIAPRPLIDDQYMKRRVHVVHAGLVESDREIEASVRAVLANPGKLGPFAFSPDGATVGLISAGDPNDPREGRLTVAPADGGPLRDLLPDLAGHVLEFAWKDARTLTYIAAVGVENELGEVTLDGSRQVLLTSGDGRGGETVPLLSGLSLSADGRTAAFAGERPTHPAEVFVMGAGAGAGAPLRLTDSNPWLAGVALASQRAVRHAARDGLELEGLLITPLDAASGPAPLILMVHGGPESHVSNGWITTYSQPGQLAAARGFAVFYPNYRGSTGRGVAFSKLGQGDAAGKEFDDLVDAVDFLADEGIADRERVGVTGGSYGGYATAWLSTYHSERFKAGVMFVGISNVLSKALTTEIPIEDKMVHTLADPWTDWQFNLERSPIFHAAKSRTALLIVHGTADERVHPSQSLQLYRELKQLGQTPVRYVRYPGEGHGNTKAAARDDYSRRLIGWMEHYLKGPGGEPPPWDLPRPAAADNAAATEAPG